MDTPTQEIIDKPNIVQTLQSSLKDFMDIEDVTVLDNDKKPRVRFRGQLLSAEEETHFDEIVQQFMALGYTPLLTKELHSHTILALPAVAKGKTGKPWVNAVLFILTFIS